MGLSTDAILCYGFQLDEEFEAPWSEAPWEGDFDQWLADKLVALKHPTEDYSESNKSAYEIYWQAIREFTVTCPVELVTHCSGEYPMYVIAVRGTTVTAYRGYPKEVNFQVLLSTRDLQLPVFRAALVKLGMEAKPTGWILCSYMDA